VQRYAYTVLEWIVIVALYLAGIGFFRLLGGVAAAGEALRRWGEAAARSRRATDASGNPS
jgi:hypothetical protein